MIVALDTQLAVGTATGVGVYVRDLAAALRAGGTDVRELHAAWLDPWRFDRRVVWDQVGVPIAAARSKANVLHAASGTTPLVRTLPTVVTVHDVAWLRVQQHAKVYARAYFGTLQARAYRRADAIVCDSHFSANEYRALVESDREVDVVYPGVDVRFAAIPRTPGDAPFALVVGTVEARKNLLAVVELLPGLPSLRVVSIGPHTPYADLVRARAAELGVGDRIELAGYVSQQRRDDLYARATLALVPSQYEGFGYALAEAQCAGLPVISSNAASLPELAATDTVLLPPGDTEAWVDAVRALLADRAAAQTQADARRAAAVGRFSWTAAAAQLVAIYARIARDQ